VVLMAVLPAFLAAETKVSIKPRLSPHASPGSTLRIDSNLVLIPVTVTDVKNQSVTGLGKEAFRIFENQTEQDVVHFSMEDAPASVGLVFDRSRSVGEELLKSRQAVAEFFQTANPEDEFFLVDFNDRPYLSVPFTNAPEIIQNRLISTQSEGRTALLDAVHMALSYMKRAQNTRRALLVISDGADNHSRYSEAEVRSLVRESDVRIYTVAIGERDVMLPEEEPGALRLLAELAGDTGGCHFSVRNSNELPRIAESIGLQLRNQYVLGFHPSGTGRDGKYHRIRVKLVQKPRLLVFSRPGYYARAQ
jgi:VWFA-related protein